MTHTYVRAAILLVLASCFTGPISTTASDDDSASILPGAQSIYVKASNTGGGDRFGSAVALSADGRTLAVGVPLEDSAAIGVGGNHTDDSATDSGAVHVFVRTGTTWTHEANIKASNTGTGDSFGTHVALSADGSTLAVGAAGEDSAATGVGGSQVDDTASGSGAVYVFTRAGTVWTQQAYVKASNTGSNDNFGGNVALSGDGGTLTVGAPGEASPATGVGGGQVDNTRPNSGAVYVFTRTGTAWSQQVYLKASNTGSFDSFGGSVALSVDGTTLAVGAMFEGSTATGVNGNQSNPQSPFPIPGNTYGAVYVFTRTGTT